MSVALAGRRIAVPETRELDVFAQMLERQGANVVRCPLVAIRDVPDPAPVVAWLQRFTSNFPDDFVLLTGEGLERLVGFARRAGMEEVFITALTRVRKINEQAGGHVSIGPSDNFHMKPMVNEIVAAFDSSVSK